MFDSTKSIEELKAQVGERQCPVCKTGKMTFNDPQAYVLMRAKVIEPSMKLDWYTDSGYVVIASKCSHCRHVEFFEA